MAVCSAITDAGVLCPATLRDLLIEPAATGLFRARWTDAVHNEWTRGVLAGRPDLTPAPLARTRHFIDAAVPDRLVTGREPLVGRLTPPDPDDRHVLAAAIRGGAGRVVTFNLKDFPAVAALAPHGIESVGGDRFACDVTDLDVDAVLASVRRRRAQLRNPPRTVREHLDRLALQTLTIVAARLRPLATHI